MVTVYGAQWCKPCKAAQQYLKQKGVAYEYIDIDHDMTAQYELEGMGVRGLPVLVFEDGDVVPGFSPREIDARLEGLG